MGDDDGNGAADGDTDTTPAAAEFAPRLRVEQRPYVRGAPSGGGVTLEVTQAAGERAIRKISVAWEPSSDLFPPDRGKRAGDVQADIRSGNGEADSLLLSGPLISVRRANQDCVTKPLSVLRARLRPVGAPEPTVTLHFLIHRQAGAKRLTTCFAEPAELPGDGTIRRVTINIDDGFQPPEVGEAVWRGFFTPAEPDGSGAVADEETEARALVPTPSFMFVYLAPGGETVAPGATLRLTGILSQLGPQPRRRVRIVAGPRLDELVAVGRVRTDAEGEWAFTLRAPRTPGRFYIRARANSIEKKCGGQSRAPAGCTSATLSGITTRLIELRVA